MRALRLSQTQQAAGCGEAHSLFGVVAVSIMDGWVDASIIFLQHTAGALVRLVV